MNALLAAFPENAMYIFEHYDYWKIKELLDIHSNGRIDAGDKLQSLENQRFNEFLNKNHKKKYSWLHLEKEYSLREIKELSEDMLQDYLVNE